MSTRVRRHAYCLLRHSACEGRGLRDPLLQPSQVEGQLAAFAEQLGASAPRGAAACRRLLTDSGAAAPGAATHSVQLSVRRSYRLVEHGAEDDDSSEHNAVTVWVDDWDAGAPWQPWASYTNPIGGAAQALPC